MTKRVAIIGSGASGLTSIKSCIESGLEPVCYERTTDVGGLWKYREEDLEGLASVMKGTYMNISKEMTAFSDFPPHEDSANYMPHWEVHEYLSQYARHFNLRKHICFQHRVIEVKPTLDHLKTKQWIVLVDDEQGNVISEEVFDAVMICTGHHFHPKLPTIPGLEDFVGHKIHSHSYKRPEPEKYEDKNVLVVGLGNSGGDIAAELSRIAHKVYLSTRKGCWIHPRMGLYGKPLDDEYWRRSNVFKKGFKSLKTILDESEDYLNRKFDHELYNLKPEHRIYNQYTVINDELPMRIINGTVKVKPAVKRITKNSVIFKEDNQTEINIDAIILATGYHYHYPFLSKDIVDFDKDPLEIYRFVFPAKLNHPETLSFIGLIDPEGSVFTVSEMQARWVCQVLTGKATLPSREKMMYSVDATKKLLDKWGHEGSTHKTRVFWFFYMEKLASYIGVKPSLFRLFFTDWSLFWACWNGPVVSYQYRINGLFSWTGARKAIMECEYRKKKPLTSKNEKLISRKPKSFFTLRKMTLTISIGLLSLYIATKNDRHLLF